MPADHSFPSVRPLDGLTVGASVDDGDTPRDVMDLLGLDAFVTGRQPYARSAHREDVAADCRLVPSAARVLREAADDDSLAVLAAGDGWTLRATHWRRSRRASVSVTASSADLADSVLGDALAGAVQVSPPGDDRVEVGFWHRSAHGPLRVPREIEAPAWSGVRGNYGQRVADAVDRLMQLRPDGDGSLPGRLLLLHGPPGTGKTTLLRALADAWRDWCQVDCVLDPERLLAEPGYLVEVALGVPTADGGERWRLLLLEDCDELVRAEAKAGTGQGLARLLNLTDGLLGQGRNVLVAITSNEDVSRLHPAVIRPGRSLAHLAVGRLSSDEARAWLARRPGGARRELPADLARDGATLAELYALGDGDERVDVLPVTAPVGAYL